MLYSIQSERHQGCWNRQLFGPYFSSLPINLLSFNAVKGKGSCLLQVSNTPAPHSSEFCGEVLHEAITGGSLTRQVKTEL